MRECIIRRATVEDMAAVASIYEHFVATSTATFEEVAPDTAEMVRRLKAVQERGLPYLVATLEQPSRCLSFALGVTCHSPIGCHRVMSSASHHCRTPTIGPLFYLFLFRF